MKKIIFIIIAIAAAIPMFAQNGIPEILISIEENNTTLKALHENADAQKLANRTGIFLDDPEVELGYLWGSPSGVGSRRDLSVTQSFDLAALTGAKSRLANSQNSLVDLQYKSDRINILLEAKKYCIELIYYNALKRELELRLQHARTMADGYRGRLEMGDISLLEYNKVRLNLSGAEGELSRVEVERQALLTELERLNGGIPLMLEEYHFEVRTMPAFEQWYEQAEEKNPLLEYVRQDIDVSRRQLSVSRTEGLPTVTAGYMQEKVIDSRYQGVTVGISVPLWNNKNNARQAKAAIRAAESREADSRAQFYAQLRNQYERAQGLQRIADGYRNSLRNVNSTQLLVKALDAGQISLLEYIVEIGLYYETVDQALQAEREYQLALAELSAVQL